MPQMEEVITRLKLRSCKTDTIQNVIQERLYRPVKITYLNAQFTF